MEHVVIVPQTTGVSAGRNHVPNPSLETNLTGYTAARGTVTREKIPNPVAGTWGGKYVASGEAGGNYTLYAYATGILAGHTYHLSYFLQPIDEQAGEQWRVWVQWYDAANVQLSSVNGPWTPCPVGEMTRVKFTTAAPTGAVKVRVILVSLTSSLPAGAGWYFDALAVTDANATTAETPYFDGDSPDGFVYHYGWAGTANASETARNRYVGTDLSCLVDSVAINHGRTDTGSQPEASSATIEFTTTATDPLPATVDVGTQIAVETFTERGGSVRFVGRVTDLTLDWQDEGENTPDAGHGQIVAMGSLADAGRRVVGDVPFPQELDGARVSRVMSAAGMPLDPLYSDPGAALLLARDIDSRAALEVAHAAAASAFGILWQTRGGMVNYADAQHRRGIPVSVTLDSCDILVTPQWRRDTNGLTNKVSIGYGVAPEGGEQPRYVASRTASITKWGTYDYSSTTELATASDAQGMGEVLLTRNSEPVWVMSDLPVDIDGLTEEEYAKVLALDMHSLVSLTGLPSLGTAPTSAALWVEGWSETLTYGRHDLTLSVSGYCRTVPPPRWDDVDPAVTWATIPPLTWDELTCLGPPVSAGRWNDQPASLRWDQLATSVTWDTYPTN